MKISLTKFEIGLLVVALISVGVGAAGYFWMTGQIETSRQELASQQQKLYDLKSRRFLPDQRNIKTLEASIQATSQTVLELGNVIKSGQDALSTVRETNPVDFKNILDESIRKMRQGAAESKVELTNNYQFSFSRYVQSNPAQSATLILGKQVKAIEWLMVELFATRPTRLVSVRRSFDEDSDNGSRTDGDALRVKSVLVGGGLYRVYPFEVEFEGSSSSLKDYLVRLSNHPATFVTRSVSVSNLDPIARRRDELKKDDLPTPEGGVAPKQPPRTIQGFEKIRARVRVDLIEWVDHHPSNTPGEKKVK